MAQLKTGSTIGGAAITSINDVNSLLSTHTALPNPHGTAASDVGALPISGGSLSGVLSVLNASATAVALTVKGASAQTANLQNWTNSGSTVLASISSAGVLTAAGATMTGHLNMGLYNITNGGTFTAATLTSDNGFDSGPTISVTGIDMNYHTIGNCLSVTADTFYTGGPTLTNSGLDMAYWNISNVGDISVSTIYTSGPTLSGSGLDMSYWDITNANSITTDTLTTSGPTVSSSGLAMNGYGITDATSISFYGSSVVLGGGGLDMGTTPIYNATSIAGMAVTLEQSNSAEPVIIARGASAHAANLQEWQDSSASVLASVTAEGHVLTNSISNSSGTELDIMPDASGTGIPVHFFRNAGTGDRPQLAIYGYADAAGTGKRYATMYIDTWDRLCFGGTAQGVMFNPRLQLNNGLGLNSNGSIVMKTTTHSSTNAQYANISLQNNPSLNRRPAVVIESNGGWTFPCPTSDSAALYVLSNVSTGYENNAAWIRLSHDFTDGVIDTGGGPGGGAIKVNTDLKVTGSLAVSGLISSSSTIDCTGVYTNGGDIDLSEESGTGQGIVLQSPDGAYWRVSVNNSGAIVVAGMI